VILRFLGWLTARLPYRLIQNEEGSVYMARMKIMGHMPGETKPTRLNIYLHWFVRPDTDRALHSHPWRWSFSLVLAGGYTEERLTKSGEVITRRLRPGRINILGPNDYHRIVALHGKETWSLFFAGPKFTGWGFKDPERGFIPHEVWFAERGMKA
jgi:hypothetical protein